VQAEDRARPPDGDPDPVITAPLYGRWHALTNRVLEAPDGTTLPNDQNWISAPEFRDLTQLSKSFSEMAALTTNAFNLGVNGTPEQLAGANVSPSLFRELGVSAQAGYGSAHEYGQVSMYKQLGWVE